MAERNVYVACDKAPYYMAVPVTFTWNSGFAKVQKQKNITALHAGFNRLYFDKKVLEISSKSMQENGDKLSAFNLMKYVPSLEKSVTVECIYQAAKTYAHGGPYLDLLNVSSHDSKTDERHKTSGAMTCFTFEGKKYPLEPRNIFYNFLYISALLENKELSDTILEYDAFTDIEFNPNKGINCQAIAAAVFRGLVKAGKIEQVKDFDSFLTVVTGKDAADQKKDQNKAGNQGQSKEESKQESKSEEDSKVQEKKTSHLYDVRPVKICIIKNGDKLKHKTFGTGTVIKIEKTVVTVRFDDGNVRAMGREWLEKNWKEMKVE